MVKAEKGFYLAVSLGGHAQGKLGDLPIDQLQVYDALLKALEERFAPPNQMSYNESNCLREDKKQLKFKLCWDNLLEG